MLASIIKFELKARFSQWLTLLFVFMMIFQGIWYSKGYYDYYGGDGMFINSAGVCYQNLAACGLLLVVVVAIITGPTLYKDLQYKSAAWVYTLPISSKQFFLGKFISAFLINVIIAFFYLLGMLLVPFSGIGEASMIGPAPIGPMLHGFFLLTVPNLFLLTSFCFAAIVLFRKPAAGYLAVFVTVLSFLLMQTNAESGGYAPHNLLAEAFAYVATAQQIDMMSIADRNAAYISFSGYLLLNRLIWFCISLALLTAAYFRFDFKYFFAGGKKVAKSKQAPTKSPMAGSLKGSFNPMPSLSLRYDTTAFLQKFWRLTMLEFKNVVRPISFRVIAGILVLFVLLSNLFWNATYYLGPQMPVSSSMTVFRLNTGVFITILLIIWSGELFFKEKTVKISQITGSLPVPVWLSQLSKLFAMYGVGLVLSLLFISVGIMIQIAKGGASEIDLGLYISDCLGYKLGWLNYCLYITLVFFLAGLTGRRFVTHFLGAGYFILLIMGFEFGLMEELRFGYGFVPGIEDFSEMNAYGMWATASFWYFVMWSALAVALALMGILFWDRDMPQRLLRKLKFGGTQLNLFGKLSIPLFVLAFIFLQSFIIGEVNDKDNFETTLAENATAAQYEQKYAYLAQKAQARYQDLELEIELYPLERKATYQVQTTLVNSSDKMIDSLVLSLAEHNQLEKMWLGGREVKGWDLDEAFDMVNVALERPLQPASSLALVLEMTKDFEGFSQGDPQASLVYRGSFGSIDEFLPYIGFDPSKTLEGNRERMEFDLPRIPSLLPPANDSLAKAKDAYRADAFRSKAKLTIGTSLDQISIGPGEMMRTWEEGGRRYQEYSISDSLPMNWYIGTGPYQVSEYEQGVAIYHLENHPYNLPLFSEQIMRSRKFLEQQLGDFPFEQTRLYEIPHYQEDHYAFPQGIALSENDGWISDSSGLKERAYLYHSIAQLLAKQWVQYHLPLGEVEGADMLKIALPEALGLHYVESSLGEEAVAMLIEKKEKIYEKERHSDINGEPSLLKADGKDYLEANRGAISLYHWSKEIGLEKLAARLNALSEQEQNVSFADLYDMLLGETKDPARQDYWRDHFETLPNVNLAL